MVRVILPNTGRGITRAEMILTDMQGKARSTLVNKSGNFRFEEVETEGTYILNASAKRYSFAPQVVNVTEDVTELIISPSP